MANNGKRKTGKIVIFEIILLVLSVVAFSYMIGQEIPNVSAQTGDYCMVFEGKTCRVSGNFVKCPSSGRSLETFCKEYPIYCKPPPASGDIIKDQLRKQCGTGATTKSSAILPTATVIGEQVAADKISDVIKIPTAEEISQNAAKYVPTDAEKALFAKALADRASLTATEMIKVNDVSKKTGFGPIFSAADIAAAPKNVPKLFDLPLKNAIGKILGNFAIASAIWAGTDLIKNHIPGVSPALAQAVGHSIAVGVFAGRTVTQILGIKGGFLGIGAGAPTIIGLGIAVLYFIFTYKETKYQAVSYSCSPWVAPFGGSDCGKCNNQEFPCTDYQCRSLGQGCELINPGTEDALCFWKNERDTKPPVIKEWEDVLTIGYKYSPERVSSPPDRGVRVENEDSEDGCVEPWTRLTIGITLNEPAICKMSETNADNFKEMENNYWSGGISKQNHSFQFSLPSPQFLETTKNITLQNNGEFALYTRCIDGNGQANTGSFVFRYCVGKADLTEPQIYATSIFNNSPIGFGETETDLTAYVNEPVECKWSRIDQDYDAMENEMACSQNAVQFNGQIVYPCSTTLNGLNDYPAKNDYYFKCRDQPELKGTDKETDRRTNGESYLFRLLGSRALSITSLEPNGTISDSTEPIKVTLKAETFAGAEEGAALCYFSNEEDSGFVQFIKTGTHEHSQELHLAEGDYTYYVRCVDAGGNSETKSTSFTVEADTESPVVVRAFHEESYLKIITNEEASCVYSESANLECTYLFETGTPMTSLENNKHQITWADKTFYIKCQDEFLNKPNEDACSIVISPYAIR